MRAFKTKWFTLFARREGIEDDSLREAIARAERGLIDADLGGGLIKQRVARKGVGAVGWISHDSRLPREKRAFFLTGFSKNDQENIDLEELTTLREIAAVLLAASETEISVAIAVAKLQEIL